MSSLRKSLIEYLPKSIGHNNHIVECCLGKQIFSSPLTEIFETNLSESFFNDTLNRLISDPTFSDIITDNKTEYYHNDLCLVIDDNGYRRCFRTKFCKHTDLKCDEMTIRVRYFFREPVNIDRFPNSIEYHMIQKKETSTFVYQKSVYIEMTTCKTTKKENNFSIKIGVKPLSSDSTPGCIAEHMLDLIKLVTNCS